ncbi:unnamed protein product, partial [Rotaria magnacalcarata]
MFHQLYYFVLLILPICIRAQEKPIALIGTIILPDKSIDNGTVLIFDRYIKAVGAKISIPNDAIIVHINGVILPGLIDVHNHLTWNIFPRWKPL